MEDSYLAIPSLIYFQRASDINKETEPQMAIIQYQVS